MDVIKSGISPQTWKKKVVCPNCEAHLKISCHDIFIRTTRKETLFSNKHIIHYCVRCEECDCKIELDSNDIPYIIKEKVYNDMDIVDRMLNFYFT